MRAKDSMGHPHLHSKRIFSDSINEEFEDEDDLLEDEE
tara:strand:+ start:1778 stop:1891 length:114 start_codon:yes stop_codon:yes gene_type:complete